MDPEITGRPVDEECPSCGIVGTGKYCHQCGARRRTAAEPLAEVLREAAAELIGFEGRLLRTLSVLFSKPGTLTAEYLRGQGARHVSPVRLYVAASAIALAAGAVGAGGTSETATDLGVLEIDLFVAVTVPTEILMYVSIPLFALLLQLALGRERKYSEYLIFALYFQSALFLISTVLDIVPTAGFFTWILLAYILFYLLEAANRLWCHSRPQALPAALGMLVLYALSQAVVVAAAAGVQHVVT